MKHVQNYYKQSNNEVYVEIIILISQLKRIFGNNLKNRCNATLQTSKPDYVSNETKIARAENGRKQAESLTLPL